MLMMRTISKRDSIDFPRGQTIEDDDEQGAEAKEGNEDHNGGGTTQNVNIALLETMTVTCFYATSATVGTACIA